MTRPVSSRMTIAALTVSAAMTVLLAAAMPADEPRQDVPRNWLDRLDDIDRRAIEANLGFAPPPFRDEVSWHGERPMEWEDLRGRVVVVQSWTNASGIGRAWFNRAQRLRQRFEEEDVVVLTVHTPEGAERAEEFISRSNPDVPVLRDERGVFSDTFGFYERPTNVVIDRQGAVRYAGLNERGLHGAVEQLLEEPFNEDETPPTHPEDEPADGEGEDDESEQRGEPDEEERNDEIGFPPHNERVRAARDRQGERAPSFHVERWVTDQPVMRDRVIVLEFWATWCGPCRRAIPHLNELQEAYRRSVTVIGLSDENNRRFEEGRLQHGLRDRDFQYALALDPDARMKSHFEVRNIPHAVIVSRDGVVRWQGNPHALDRELIDAIVEADSKLGDDRPRRQRHDRDAADGDDETDPTRRIYRWTDRPDA